MVTSCNDGDDQDAAAAGGWRRPVGTGREQGKRLAPSPSARCDPPDARANYLTTTDDDERANQVKRLPVAIDP